MSTVFISFRRADEPFAVDQIEQHLESALGPAEVFRDTSDIASGEDYRRVMDDAIRRHAVVLVVIGPDWSPERLQDPRDNVRFEIERALELGKRVLPVLVGSATWPSVDQLPPTLAPLATVSYVAFRSGADRERDLKAIVAAIVANRPVLVRGTLPGWFGIGKVEVRLDGQELGRGTARTGVSFGPVAVLPGDHVVDVSYRALGVGQHGRHPFVVRKPGEWHLESRTSGRARPSPSG